MIMDYILLGKGPSVATFPFDRLLEPYPIVAINEALTMVPIYYQAPVWCVVQDWDPIRRIAVSSFHEPEAIYIPSEYAVEARRLRDDLRWRPFRLCDAPKGPTACIAMWMMRNMKNVARHLSVGCVGMDAYFGGSTRYAPAFAERLSEPIYRRGDYDDVNGKINLFAKNLAVDLFDLTAEVAPDLGAAE